jgi:glycosyltransferase involved in cell wall biosynthesis
VRNLLLFAHECAPHHRPESTIGAQRPAGFARSLPKFGWRAVVLTCDIERRRSATRKDLPRIVEDALVRFRTADPKESVILPLPSLRRGGLVDRMSYALPTGEGLAGLAGKPLTALRAFAGDWSASWQPVAQAVADALTAETHFDACLGEHSPDAGIFLARWFHRRHGVPWAADFRDPALAAYTPRSAALYAPVLRRLVSTAAFSVAVTPRWAELDREDLRLPVHCIPNGFIPEEFAGTPAPIAPAPLRVVYAGRIASQQDLRPFLLGMGRLAQRDPGAAEHVRFVYRGRSHALAGALADACGVRGLVDIGDEIPRERCLELLTGADLLLLLSAAGVEGNRWFEDGFYPGKVMEYLGARRPMLCVPGDGGVLDELLGETRAGSVARTPEEVARFLEVAAEIRAAGRALPYEPDEAVVAGCTRERQSLTLAGLLDGLVRGPRRSPARPRDERRRILMLVHNAMHFDQRVRRHAGALAAAGHEVAIVGVATREAEAGARGEVVEGVTRHYTRGRRDGSPRARFHWFVSAFNHHFSAVVWRRGYRGAWLAERFLCPALGDLLALARGLPSDLIYCNDLNTVPVGRRLARERRVPLLYDAHEYYAGERGGIDASEVEAIRMLEGAGLKEAAAVLTVSPLIAARLAEEHGVPLPVVVRNVPPDLGPPSPGATPRAGLPLRVVYHSANLSLHGRQLKDLLDAVALHAGRIHLRLRGNTTPERQRELRAYLGAHLPPTSWSLRPAVPFEALMAEAALCDVGVVLNSGILENERLTLPNKVFEYMMAGLAVAAYRTGPVADIVEGEGVGLVTTDNTAEGLGRILGVMVEDRALVASFRERGLIAARERHCWERESARLVAAVDRVLNRTAP